jgi:hypothetical protein
MPLFETFRDARARVAPILILQQSREPTTRSYIGSLKVLKNDKRDLLASEPRKARDGGVTTISYFLHARSTVVRPEHMKAAC